LEAEKKSRSLASLGMTKSAFSAAFEAVRYVYLTVLTQTHWAIHEFRLDPIEAHHPHILIIIRSIEATQFSAGPRNSPK